tara:strand:- start:89 stop:460 length:372 start_codon:yes stop_codon:yes gene_type:complete
MKIYKIFPFLLFLMGCSNAVGYDSEDVNLIQLMDAKCLFLGRKVLADIVDRGLISEEEVAEFLIAKLPLIHCFNDNGQVVISFQVEAMPDRDPRGFYHPSYLQYGFDPKTFDIIWKSGGLREN